ncbi:MAG: amidase [Rhodospirillales bacterium]|nr:amidase [Rhodospirillales bacterium]
MKLSEYADLDGLGIAELVKTGEISAAEAASTALEAIDAVNPQLNAVIEDYPDRVMALETQDPPDGPLKGVPFLVKDLVVHEAGQTNELGSRLAKGLVAPGETELMRRFKAAGLVNLGRTTTPEFGFCATVEALLYGPTHNPWNLGHSPGGSSGGSSAMVAARAVPIAHANDGGGSIRGPASWCGLVGLKPTRGRNPLGPDYGELIGGLVCEHVVTRTVRDSAAILDATAGADPGAPYVAPVPSRPFLDEVGADPGRLKIAFSARSIHGHDPDPACAEAVEQAARLCEGLGHQVVEDVPAVDGGQLAPLFGTLWAAFGAWTLRDWEVRTGRTATPEQFEKHTWIMSETDKNLRASDLAMAMQNLQRFARKVAGFHETYDVWLTPTMNTPPPPLGFFEHVKEDRARARLRMEAAANYTSLCNVTGQPAISLPLHQTADGLPVGVQLIGRYGDEAALFRLSAQLEAAQPWADKWPGVS